MWLSLVKFLLCAYTFQTAEGEKKKRQEKVKTLHGV